MVRATIRKTRAAPIPRPALTPMRAHPIRLAQAGRTPRALAERAVVVAAVETRVRAKAARAEAFQGVAAKLAKEVDAASQGAAKLARAVDAASQGVAARPVKAAQAAMTKLVKAAVARVTHAVRVVAVHVFRAVLVERAQVVTTQQLVAAASREVAVTLS